MGTFFAKLGGHAGIFINSYSLMVHKVLGLSFEVMKIFTAMWLASFAMTTLDTSNRLARYVFAEIADPLRDRFRGLHRLFTNRWVASLIPAAIGCALAWSGGYLFLWPAFSAANQLLASIALVTSAAWVYKKLSRKHFGLLIVPGAVLWITVSVALGWYLAVVVPVIYRARAAQGIAIGAMMVIMFLLNLVLLVSFFRNFRKSGDAL
jgi:carbon starvation protein